METNLSYIFISVLYFVFRKPCVQLIPDQAARDPCIVGTVLKRDLIPDITVFLDLVAGRFDLRAVVDLRDDLALEAGAFSDVRIVISLIAMFIISVIVLISFFIFVFFFLSIFFVFCFCFIRPLFRPDTYRYDRLPVRAKTILNML